VAWAKKPAWKGSGFTRVAMELADLSGHPARATARRHKTAVEGWFAEQFAQNGVGRPRDLARHVTLLIEGCLSLVLIHGDTSYAEAAAAAARQLVERDRLDPPSKQPLVCRRDKPRLYRATSRTGRPVSPTI